MGPTRKSNRQKKFEGSRPDRITNPIKPRPKAPECPRYMPPEGRQVWASVVEDLDDVGILAKIDGPALEALCMAVVTHRKAARDVAKRGVLVRGDRGPVKNPSLQVMRDAGEKIRTLGREFGMTPLSRAGIDRPEISDDELNSILDPLWPRGKPPPPPHLVDDPPEPA